MILTTKQRKLKLTNNNSNFQQLTGTSTRLPTPSLQPAITQPGQFIRHSWRSDPQDISRRVPVVEDE